MGAAAEEEVVVEVLRVSAGRPRANRAASRRAAAASVRRPLARTDLLTLIPSMRTTMTRSKAAVMSTTMLTSMVLRTRRTERRTMRRRRMCTQREAAHGARREIMKMATSTIATRTTRI